MFELYNDLLFLPEKIKTEKLESIACNLHDKKEYVVHIRTIKQAANHGLVLKKCIEPLNQIKKLG